MIPVNKGQGGHRIIEVIDPLCPACEAFSKVFKASKQLAGLDVKGVLFPLEKDCNWMIPQTLHPGSCAISEAVLCAGEGKVGAVLEWAMARNEELRSMAQENPQAVVAEIKKTFPELASCVGSPEAKSKVNKSLRWIVGNALPVLTPQLYVDGRRLCTEDTDLGFEYAMKKLLALSPAAQLGSADQKRPVKR
jgi:hypothetical protein